MISGQWAWNLFPTEDVRLDICPQYGLKLYKATDVLAIGLLRAKSPFSLDFESLGSVFGGYPEVSYKIFIQTKTGKACQVVSSLWEVGLLGAWRKPLRAESE